MHIAGIACDFWKLVGRKFAMQESKQMSGFLYSKILLWRNPSSLSLCIWVCVERSVAMLESMRVFVALVDSCFAKVRSTGIQKHHDGLPGFLHIEIAL